MMSQQRLHAALCCVSSTAVEPVVGAQSIDLTRRKLCNCHVTSSTAHVRNFAGSKMSRESCGAAVIMHVKDVSSVLACAHDVGVPGATKKKNADAIA